MATLRNMILCYTDQSTIHFTCNYHLRLFQLAYNSSVHAFTQFLSFFLIHGCEARIPATIAQDPQQTNPTDYTSGIKTALFLALDLAQLINLQSHISNVFTLSKLQKLPDFQVGQEVLLFSKPLSQSQKAGKLTCTWKEPYCITLISGNCYSLLPLHVSTNRILHNVHAHRLKLFHAHTAPSAIEDTCL
ncbi:hypothetical protein PHYBLDRAFT_151174 [Phycomyces blakesleeanus NRRL 1555(-)]|uniref:Uncharacterized protein n=1 Tax=Phycomyces blakesleeanus (strain ATCC 8743b / DSM 1359 / FGSC 10004 / NBRC 33097 / NRRL 1555) TaxID=763407 RepID=A0A162N1W3_PHYB8|nr:hypothetical protein PHYBLDRAFT_151174 [Phycomyces blakesleeanus NRRL 1555(-)]OAD67658.1 hypothetical protein PHYBLDRAFT_151174 [Phycomyces blakesleeanus NRRL 1555(-)]|eukprot:XP_018285698.1 hypothetical protein PHYBLDRAFT_151174 [Phycomyces blakesleeanus NRRL 1555(-)]